MMAETRALPTKVWVRYACSRCGEEIESSRGWPETTSPLCWTCSCEKDLQDDAMALGEARDAEDFGNPDLAPAIVRMALQTYRLSRRARDLDRHVARLQKQINELTEAAGISDGQ